MHRDLKSPNILINLPRLTVEELNSPGFNLKEYTKKINFIGVNSEPIEVKIADLGFARELEQSDLASTMAGSPLTMAPEALA